MTSVLLTLLILEAAIRVRGYDPEISKEMRFHPSLGWTMDPEWSRADHVNSDGFRFPAVTPEKTPGQRRLLVLGDSFSAGTSFPYSMTFPGRLQRWLTQGDDDWQVINLSAGDWGNAQQLLALREYGRRYEPDVVVLQLFPFNDLCNDGIELADTCSLRDYLRPYLQPTSTTLTVSYHRPLSARLIRLSRLFAFGYNQILWELRTRRGVGTGDRAGRQAFFEERSRPLGIPGGALASLMPPDRRPPAVEAAWDQMRAILTATRTAVTGSGGVLIGVVIPFAWTLNPHWERYGRGYPELEPDNGTSQAETFLRELGIATVSLRDEITRGPVAAVDCFLMPRDSHLNAFGHAAVAGWIMQAMHREGVISPVEDPLAATSLDAFDEDVTPPALFNFSALEGADRPHIYAYGPQSRIAFPSGAPGSARLGFEARAEVPDLRIRFQYTDENPGEVFLVKDEGAWVSGEVQFPVVKGRNSIRVSFSNWVGKDEETPRRPAALLFEKLRIEMAGEEEAQ